MSGDSIPEDVRNFILSHIDSIAQLEALLLLRREPEGAWDAASVGRRLYIANEAAGDLLTRLRSGGFLETNSEIYRFQCRTPELERFVERVADVYSRQLIPVTHLIHARPSRIREFANAFKLRKEP